MSERAHGKKDIDGSGSGNLCTPRGRKGPMPLQVYDLDKWGM